jgi:hypothetical protein
MFNKISDAAEKLATNVSRRAFMGRVGQGALGLAAVIGGMLALPAKAHASNATWCVIVPYNGGGCWYYKSVQGTCPCGYTYVTTFQPRCRKMTC